MSKQKIGVVGAGVMGQNLALNIERNGFSVAIFDLDTNKVDAFLAKHPGKNIVAVKNPTELADVLETPRRVLMMVPAGAPVDKTIEGLLPSLDKADILIDGGNSNFEDTNRRTAELEAKGFQYIGTGVSGGEEGALWGPSIMPGGSPGAWPHVKPILQAIAAKTPEGDICCDWVGENGAGHFVKMVHNGIEYGDMQMICEAYQLMKVGLGMPNEAMADVFDEWYAGDLNSYLIEITRDILRYKNADGEATIDQILDTAGQKGTGKWTGITALDLGQPLTLIAEAVFARCLSAIKDERVVAGKILGSETQPFTGDKAGLLKDLGQALFASKIVSYAQGYQLMRAAGEEYGWHLNFGGIAMLWRAGCIIRSAFLGKIKEAYDNDPNLTNLLVDPFFAKVMTAATPAWRRIASTAITLGIPMPALTSALSYYDGYRNPRLPANLLQAQRDYFGAHTYERLDQPRGQFYHTDWIGDGGETRMK